MQSLEQSKTIEAELGDLELSENERAKNYKSYVGLHDFLLEEAALQLGRA